MREFCCHDRKPIQWANAALIVLSNYWWSVRRNNDALKHFTLNLRWERDREPTFSWTSQFYGGIANLLYSRYKKSHSRDSVIEPLMCKRYRQSVILLVLLNIFQMIFGLSVGWSSPSIKRQINVVQEAFWGTFKDWCFVILAANTLKSVLFPLSSASGHANKQMGILTKLSL